MSTILAIDTSATPVSCAVLQDGKVLASYYSHTGMTHSQTLMPMIESSLSVSGVLVSALDALAVSVGPGSFTGVRIGVSAVKGLAFANTLPCVAVSTLEAMAENIKGLPFEGIVCCVMDARCQQVYTASFLQLADGRQERITEDEALAIDELKKRLICMGKSVILVGDGAEMCYNIMKDELSSLYLAPVSVRYQSAVGVATTACAKYQAGEVVPAEELLPVYLRLPQAERELKARLNNRAE